MRANCEAPGERELRVVFSFDRSDLRIEHSLIGVVVHLRDCPTAGEPGSPALPRRVVRVALPAQTRMTAVDVRALQADVVAEGPVPVAPLQLPRPGTSVPPQGGETPPYRRPEETQRERRFTVPDPRQQPKPLVEPYPNPPFVPADPRLYEEAMQRPAARALDATREGANAVVAVELNPVRLTAEGGLELQTQIEVIVRYERDERLDPSPDIHSRAQAQRQIALTRRTVINREVVFDYSIRFPALAIATDYLIITDNRQWDPVAMTAGADAGGNLVAAFARLAQWKRRRGLSARVVTVTDIAGGVYGNFRTGSRDLQEVIRRFLKFAYSNWGVAWVLLGGDTSIVPVRRVAGSRDGGINRQATNPPPDNTMAWAGDHMRMKVKHGAWWNFGHSTANRLVRVDNGLLIPYDAAGTSSTTSRGWFFTTDHTYATRSATPTEFIRVNGPASEVDAGTLQFLYEWNTIPTDLYYSSLIGAQYDQPGRRDWDLNDNGLYGQHGPSSEIDGINYTPSVSIGRAPVRNAAEADVFVNKVLSYEKYERPDGTALDADWPRRVLLVSENWGGRLGIEPTAANPPGDNLYHNAAGATHTIIKLKDVPDWNWSLLAQITDADVRLIPYRTDAAAAGRGWYFARSATDLGVSGVSLTIFGNPIFLPMPSRWIAVFGTTAERAPARYVFNHLSLDGSLADQEQLREQIRATMPGFNSFRRLYEDVHDMTQEQLDAAPVEILTTPDLLDELNRGPHIVSLSGHGYWGGCCRLDYAVADTVINGSHTFIAYADSCLTNQFDGNSMSEHLLRNPNGGAVAYIGSTRFSWIGAGDDIQRRFFQEWASLAGDAHLGLLFDTRAAFYNSFYWADGRWSVLSLNLMGDPEMPLWWTEPYRFREPVLVEFNPFRLRFPEPDPPEPWFELPYRARWTETFIHLQQGQHEQMAFTRGGETVEIPRTGFQPGPATLTITRPGHYPIVKEVTLPKQAGGKAGCLGWLRRLFG